MNSVECASPIVKVPIQSDSHGENVYVVGTCLDRVPCFKIDQWACKLQQRTFTSILTRWELDVLLECAGAFLTRDQHSKPNLHQRNGVERERHGSRH